MTNIDENYFINRGFTKTEEENETFFSKGNCKITLLNYDDTVGQGVAINVNGTTQIGYYHDTADFESEYRIS